MVKDNSGKLVKEDVLEPVSCSVCVCVRARAFVGACVLFTQTCIYE